MDHCYIDQRFSAGMGYKNIDKVIETVACKYMADNPAVGFWYVPSFRDGFWEGGRQAYHIDLLQKYPEAENGDYAYVAGAYYAEREKNISLSLKLHGRVCLWVNQEKIYQSNAMEEMNLKQNTSVKVTVRTGLNIVLFKITKTALGFGVTVPIPIWAPVYFFAPFPERKLHAGFVWSELFREKDGAEFPVSDKERDGAKLPVLNKGEAESGIKWYPTLDWAGDRKEQNPFMRIFPEREQGIAVSYSEFDSQEESVTLKIEVWSRADVYIDGEHIMALEAGTHMVSKKVAVGSHRLLLAVKKDRDCWGAEIRSSNVALKAPENISGYEAAYFGILPADFDIGELSLVQLYLTPGDLCWKLDAPDCIIQIFLQNENFGKWNYPVGVTIYGLTEAGRYLNCQKVIDYTNQHVKMCVDAYGFARRMFAQFGVAGLNEHMQTITCLDNCGSFGSCMLETLQGQAGMCAINDAETLGAQKGQENQTSAHALEIADEIADFMMNKLERMEDGAFYRNDPGYPVVETLWADDLYMSIPFLCRYYLLTGEGEILNEAVRQFHLYDKYLYMPDKKLLSHVYDKSHNMQTKVAWGRGNGWFIFSLAELLTVLPKEHEEKEYLIQMFQRVCEGFLNVQAADGMWRQVLDKEDAYEESSATAMITYSFLRAVRLHWMEEDFERCLKEAAQKAIDGLTHKCIDQWGNVYGTSAGSYFSYDPDYYAKELPWKLNDTHGIGIVLLALCEWAKFLE